jgi:hypothetical protein
MRHVRKLLKKSAYLQQSKEGGATKQIKNKANRKMFSTRLKQKEAHAKKAEAGK